MTRTAFALSAALWLVACDGGDKAPSAPATAETAAPGEAELTADTAAATRKAVADTEAAAQESGAR